MFDIFVGGLLWELELSESPKGSTAARVENETKAFLDRRKSSFEGLKDGN